MYMGAVIGWTSKKLRVVPQSSTEAETAAGVNATKDTRFAIHILNFLGAPRTAAVPLLIDNEGMWFNVRNEGVSGRTRYWELWLAFVPAICTSSSSLLRSRSTPVMSARTSSRRRCPKGTETTTVSAMT